MDDNLCKVHKRNMKIYSLIKEMNKFIMEIQAGEAVQINNITLIAATKI